MRYLGFRDDPGLYRECRECGHTVETGETRCPECGGDIAEYQLSR